MVRLALDPGIGDVEPRRAEPADRRRRASGVKPRQAPSTCTWASATGAEPSARSVSEISPGVSRAASTDSSSTGGAAPVSSRSGWPSSRKATTAASSAAGSASARPRPHQTTSKWLIQPSSANSDWWAWNM